MMKNAILESYKSYLADFSCIFLISSIAHFRSMGFILHGFIYFGSSSSSSPISTLYFSLTALIYGLNDIKKE